MKKPLAALGLVLLLVLSACGGSDKKAAPELSKEEKAVAAKIADTFSSADTGGTLSTKEAKCFADGFVDKVGLEKLEESKLITADGEVNQSAATFDKALSEKFADAFLACVEYQKRQAEEIAKADTSVDAEKLGDCLEKELPTSFVKKLIVASQTQSSDSAKLTEEATKKLSECKTDATKKSGSSSSPSSSPSASPTE